VTKPSYGSHRLDRLIKRLGRLPGIGSKSAARIALHLLADSEQEVTDLLGAVKEVKEHVRPCERCGGIAESELCSICGDPRRDRGELCVVAQATDCFNIERAAVFRGRYHVLGGLLSPLDGVQPSDLNFSTLVERVEEEQIQELVIALAASVEGEATALYLQRMISNENLRMTRLATGIPVGGHLDFVDDVTLERAFAGRRPFG
jgi:recombination protein RecR